MNTQSHSEDFRSISVIINDIESDIEKRKHLRRFLEIMIAICITAIVILVSLLAFPQVIAFLNIKQIKFLLLELYCFFPYVTILAILFSLLGINKKSNSSLIIRILVYNAALTFLPNLCPLYADELLLKNAIITLSGTESG